MSPEDGNIGGDQTTVETGWSPIKRVNLSEEIVNQLITRIVGGHLKLGERLPPERDLAQLLEVGRPAVREAIRALSAIGLVDVRPGEGTFIVKRYEDFLAQAFSWTILVDSQTLSEITDVRIAIECQQARLAARNATPERIELFKEQLSVMEEATGEYEAFYAADLEFHELIAEAAGNLALERLMVAARSLLHQWIERAARRPGGHELANVHHRHIVSAIEVQDEDAAEEAMRVHVETIGRYMMESALDVH
jgi:GntR family transcriptional repressor for pyruvate dehydrogenase complex